MTALDFSYARPGGATLTANGITSVGRYLGTDGRCITPGELNDYLTNEISVWFIKENSSRGMLNGYNQGYSDAQAAQQQLNVLGQPNAVVYFTADFDIQPYQFTAGDQYLTGAGNIIPVSRLGLYAGNDYLNHAARLVTYRWKTASSSFDHGQTANVPVHLIQTTNATLIPNTDYDIIVIADHGQVGALGTTTAGTTETPLTSTRKVTKMNPYVYKGSGGVIYIPVETANGTLAIKQLTQDQYNVLVANGAVTLQVTDTYLQEFRGI